MVEACLIEKHVVSCAKFGNPCLSGSVLTRIMKIRITRILQGTPSSINVTFHHLFCCIVMLVPTAFVSIRPSHPLLSRRPSQGNDI